MPTLFQIGEEWKHFDTMCEELPGGEMTPEAEARFDAWATSIAENEAEKLEGYCQYIRQLEMEAATAKAEEEQFAMKRRARENRMKWLKDRMVAHLQGTGRHKIQTSAGRTLAVTLNSVAPCEVEPTKDPKDVPDELCIVERKIHKDAVKKFLESGGELTWARMLPRGHHLRIR